MLNDKPVVIRIVSESVAESWAHDLSTYALAVGLFAPGVWLDSGAMQWAGLTVWLLAVLARANASENQLTIAQARAKLDELEGSEKDSSNG